MSGVPGVNERNMGIMHSLRKISIYAVHLIFLIQKCGLLLNFLELVSTFLAMATLSSWRLNRIYFRAVVLMFSAVWANGVLAQDTNLSSPNLSRAAETAVASDQALRSYLQLQEQLHNTQEAIEKNRQEAEVAAARNNTLLEERLKLMEKSLALQRLDDLKGMQRSDRTILIASGIFLAVGFLVLIGAGLLQWTAMNRLGIVMSKLGQLTASPVLGVAGGLSNGFPALEESTSRFMKLMERMEQRIELLEGSPVSAALLNDRSVNAIDLNGADSIRPDDSPSGAKSRAIALLLGKGQSLLKLDQAEAAMNCLDEVLGLDPGNTEALVKKGAALERLQRFDEAVDCYDRAIARDNSMTMAYLYKGGVFNRMERYSEALECYEKALKTRQKNQETPFHVINGGV